MGNRNIRFIKLMRRQVEENNHLERPLTVNKVIEVITNMKNKKTAGIDGMKHLNHKDVARTTHKCLTQSPS